MRIDYQSERNKEIFLLAISGIPFKEVAKKYDIHPERVRQIIYKVAQKIRRNIRDNPDINREFALDFTIKEMRDHRSWWTQRCMELFDEIDSKG